MKSGVSLVCTVYNEHETILGFLESVYAMDPLPEEFIILDGGSGDGTTELIASFVRVYPTPMAVRHMIDPECNRRFTEGAIARGRNAAVSAARADIIAVTDAGCTLDSGWLGHIVGPIASGAAEVAGGWYLPDARTRFEQCVGEVWLVPPASVDPDGFLPSSRSIAFRKSAWAAVGGYPEHTYYAEDTMFDLALRRSGYDIAYVPEALVRWRMKSSFRKFARLVYDYGFGDGSNRIMTRNLLRSAAKLGAAAVLAACSVFIHPAWSIALLLYWAILAGRHAGSGDRASGTLLRLPCAVAVKLVADASYLVGHLRGRLSPARAPVRGASR